MPKTTARKVLRLAKEHRPATPSAFNKCGIPLRLVSGSKGLFRVVYKVTNCDLVVKFPKGAEGKEHTRDEVTRIRKLRKWHVMKKHLPTIFYYDSKSAVLILSYHPRFTTHEKEADAMGKFIQELVRAATRVSVTDIHSDNVHKSVSGDTAIIIDFGY